MEIIAEVSEVLGMILDWAGRITSLAVLVLLAKGIIKKLIAGKASKAHNGSSKDAALIVSTDKDKDNSEAVNTYLQDIMHVQWKSYDVIMQRSAMNENAFSADHYISDLLEELHKKLKIMRKDGVETVHLFYAGPGALLAPVIAELHNNFTCILYHYDKGTYYEVKCEDPGDASHGSKK